MNMPSWLTSVRHLFNRHHSAPRRRRQRLPQQGGARDAERLEDRRLLAFDLVAAFVQPGQPFYTANVSPSEVSLDAAPQQIILKFSPGVEIDSASLGSISVVRSGRGGDPFEPSISSQYEDAVVEIGSITVNDAPNQNEVVIRFAETLPDDTYRIDVGAGLLSEAGDLANAARFDIRLNLGAQVVSVVPQPVIRSKTIEFKEVPADGDLLTVSIRGKQLAIEFDDGTGPAVATGRIGIVTTGLTTQEIAEAVRDAVNTSTNFDGERGADATVAVAVGGNGPTLTIHGATFTPLVSATRGAAALVAGVITVGDGALSHLRDRVIVYFNVNDPLALASAENTGNYRLIEVDPVIGNDVGLPVLPAEVAYDSGAANAVLTFAADLDNGKLFRLEVGNNGSVAGVAIALVESGAEANSSYGSAAALGTLSSAGATINGEIRLRPTVPTPAGALQFPTQPGSIDEVGHRDIPVNQNSEQHGDAEAGAGNANAIPAVRYNFQSYYGDDPQGNPLFNAITETQKQRAREIFDIYSQYAGVRFIETADQGITVVTGDMRAISPTINTAPAGLAGGTNRGLLAAIMDSTDNWGVSEYGGSWFRVAMHEIGHALGLAHSYDIPSIMGGGLTGEAVFPGDYDLIHMEMLYPKTGSDIDIYSFALAADGRLTAETIVARPGTAVTSYLDTVLTLYREVTVGAATTQEMVARNDDYFGRDSFIGLDLTAADENGNPYTYYIAVTSTGNTDFNPTVEDSGYGGRTQGAYQLRLGFDAIALPIDTIIDASGTSLDGDRDGTAGGVHNFWFNTASGAATVYVDKAAPVAGANGTLSNPYTEIDVAISAVNAANAVASGSKTLIRIVGNDGNAASLTDGRPYLIGRTQGQSGATLEDGVTFNIPQGVTTIIDEGAVLKLRGAVIDVGSASTQASESRAGASLQVLGTPERSVRFTSYHDDQWGGNSDGVGPVASGGQWGGIVLRQDSDALSKRSFVNTVSHADIRYGGGQVLVNSQLRSFTPIQFESTRPTIAFNRITQSAGAAISADPNAFGDSNGRLGPELRGNVLTSNSINGVLVRITTELGSELAKLTVPARFKSTDIVYVIAENLLIDGGAGGYLESGGNVFARATGRLTIDPGVVVKLVGSRIELERGGSRLYAEGLPGRRVIFTSLADNRFGAGGTFDTNGNQPNTPAAGDWAGIVLNAGSAASIDTTYIGFGGGTSPIEGTVASFNVLETHQGELRLANSRVDNNAGGFSSAGGVRVGRGSNAAATIFVRGAQPVIFGNDFRDNRGSIVSINANALNDRFLGDYGRSTGEVVRETGFDNNLGPLVRENVISYTIDAAAGRPAGGAIGGMEVRAEEITVEAVWDDTDIVHVLRNEIIVNNFHTATGLQLRSSPDASLVVKLLGANAGLTAAGYGLQIDDRIGGTVQVLGQPGYPVVFTSLHDDTIYASLNPLGIPVRDTGNDGTATVSTAGDWRGLEFLSMSNDRNVATLAERELANTGGLAALQINNDVDSAQVLGVLGPNFQTVNAQGIQNGWESAQEKGGDDVRRLGFEVNGTIAFDDPADVDVYFFEGYAGSEVWIDVDKTSPSLDAMVELLDANGNLLARSADALNDIGIVRSNSPDVVDENAGGGQSRSFDLTNQRILPGTLSGVVYEDNTAIQTFTVSRNGTFTFARIGDPGSEAIALTSSLNQDTGVITLGFDNGPTGTIRVEAAYEFARLPLSTLGFTSAGDPLGAGEHGAYSLTKNQWRGNDTYSTNPRDPGMRVTLPGVVGNLSRYYIRVRSQPAYGPVADYATDLETTTAGATSGNYQLRVRLRQQDEKPGSTVSYADLRYPVVGIDVVGLPRNSQLVGENGENQTDANNAFSSAQQLGNLLATDRNTISVAGEMANAGDVDWYSFTLDYTDIQSIGGVNAFAKTWATMFDIDYADGFRGDLTLSVFDDQGRLLYVGRDSDIADDQPAIGQGDDFDDLSRGSLGKLDPFIGSVQMPAGGPGSSTRYFVAISSNERLPNALNATFTGSAVNPLIRLEPINSLARIVEDRIEINLTVGDFRTGYNALSPAFVDTVYRLQPETGAIIDISSATTLAANVRPFTLADVTLFVSTGSSLVTVDPFSGGVETRPGNGVYTDGSVGDIDMRTDGRLFLYYGRNNDTANNGVAYEVDTGNGQIGRADLLTYGDGISNDPDTPTNWQITGQSVDALAIGRTDVATYSDSFFYSIREQSPGFTTAVPGDSILYRGRSASNNSAAFITNTWAGRIGEIGSNIGGTAAIGRTTGMQFRNDQSNQGLFGVSDTGRFYQINTANADATGLADFANVPIPVSQGGGTLGGFQGLTAAPVNLEGGRYQGSFFAITSSGRLVCITDGDPATGGFQPALMANVFDSDADGYADSYVSNVMIANPTGLAFSPLDVNLWHPTNRRGDYVNDPVAALDPGHGVNAAFDNTRLGEIGGASMYFGLENWDDRIGGYISLGGPTQFGTATSQANVGHGYDWQRDLTANPAIGNNYNLAGGAYGSLITNAFSLSGYSYTDKPTLYFNYFLDTQDASGKIDSMRDSARVFVSDDDGLTWEVIATNNQSRSINGLEDGELPNRLSTSSAIGSADNQHVQELFDSTGTWRQARVDLGQWAGASNIRLRFDFSTAGEFDPGQNASATPDAIREVAAGGATTGSSIVTLDSVEGLQVGMFVRSPLDTVAIDDNGVAVFQRIPSGTQVVAINAGTGEITLSANVADATGLATTQLRFFREQANLLNDINGLANETGDFRFSDRSHERGANNSFEGFYVDDIIVGFAERGEMVTGAVAGQSDVTFSLDTPVAGNYFEQVLQGPYQLEIRRGTEYASQPSSGDSQAGIYQTFDTNDRLVRADAATVHILEQNPFSVIDGVVLDSRGSGSIQANVDTSVGVVLAGAGDETSPTEHNLLLWRVDLANQSSAFLEFQYRTHTDESLVPLPETFLLDADNQLPYGDGVAVSVDGGTTWRAIANFTSTQIAWRQVRLDLARAAGPLTAQTVIGFFQSDTQSVVEGSGIAIRGVSYDPDTGLDGNGARNVLITTAPRIATSGLVGDSNLPREQGQFIVENNIISDASQYGIRVDAANRAAGSNAPTPGVVRNLPTINADRLVPGAVINNNVILGSGSAGILFSGQTNSAGVPNAAVPFGRIFNNTIYGGAAPFGTGVQVTDNAGPTLLNNIFANLATGVNVADAGSRNQSFVGYSAYYNTTQSVVGVTESNGITLDANPFVNVMGRNFYLAAGSLAIDSSLDVLQDRDSHRVVKDAVGIPPSPILAPDYDLYGQLRLDDPGVAGAAPGLGLDVFKDRGAVERADFDQPVAALKVPNADGSQVDLTSASARGQSRFVVQLTDDGAGIDDSTVSSDAFVVLYRQLVSAAPWSSEQSLEVGSDYVFTYLENTKTVVFEAPAVFDYGQYLIVVDNASIRDRAGNGLLNNDLNGDGTTAFAIGLSDVPAAPSNLRAALDEDGEGTLSVTLTWDAAVANGDALIDYTLTEAGNTAPVTAPVTVNAETRSYTISGLVVDETYSFTVRARNSLGSSAESATVTFVARPLPRFRLETDSGVDGDGVTNDPTIEIYENVTPEDSWQYTFDAGLTWLPGSGDLKFDLPLDGTYSAGSIGVRQVVDGTPGGARFNQVGIVLDRVVATPTATLRSDTGSSSSDGVTNNGMVDVAMLEAGGTWEYSVDGGLNWISGIGAELELEEGDYAAGKIMVRQSDLAANQSESGSVGVAVKVDRTAPAAVNWSIVDSGVAGDFITNSSLVTIDIEAVEEGGFWQYSNSQTTGGAYVLGNGASFQLPVGESFGFVRQIDLAGNVGEETRYPIAGMVTFDNAVATPVLSLRADTGISSTDRLTKDGTINVLGLEPGLWQYRTSSTGAWQSLENSSFVVPDGTYASGQIQARQTDLAGNVSAVGVLGIAIIVDSTVSEPIASLAEDTGRSRTDGITRNGRVNVRTETGATWRYSVNSGASWTTGIGTFFTLPAGDYPAGTVLVEQYDKAGNAGFATLADITVDQAVRKPVLRLQEDTGTPTDGITSNGTIDVTSLDADATWEYSTNSGTRWTAGPEHIDAASFFELLPKVYSRNVIRVRQTDIAGNVSPVAAYSSSITVDTSTPTVTRVTSSAANGVYGFGRVMTIPIQVTFSKPVIVSDGNLLVLQLNTTSARDAVYTRGSGTSTLTFTYTIQTGDSSLDLGYASTAALVGGTIVNGAGTAANRSLPELGSRLSLNGGKAIVVQTVISAAAKVGVTTLSTSAASPTNIATGLRDITITFNTSVIGVSLSNVRLLRDGVSVELASVTMRRLSATTYRLSLPASLTAADGDYTLEIGGLSSTIKSGLQTMTTASVFYWRQA